MRHTVNVRERVASTGFDLTCGSCAWTAEADDEATATMLAKVHADASDEAE
jgi:hypothetical protein